LIVVDRCARIAQGFLTQRRKKAERRQVISLRLCVFFAPLRENFFASRRFAGYIPRTYD
jgi:hypothetical protein